MSIKSLSHKIISVIDSLKSWQVAILILVVGFTVFFSGLNGGFQGDDTDQIIKNDAVHSISNIGLFFRSSTFWNGETLVGDFYRPTMTTAYSIIYTFFGANPAAYHVVQLLIYSACAFMLFLFLRTMFKQSTALLLSLIFLVHPINSQIVYSIPSMQEPLMFIFGISALYVLTREKTIKNLSLATFLLFMSLMSKETAIVFVCVSVLYLFIYSRESLVKFVKMIILPVILYIIIRISVVGFGNIAQSAPVDYLSFGERMFMVPSLILFYITKFFFPRDIATSYYWTHNSFSINGFLVPLLIVLSILAIFASVGWLIFKKGGQKQLFKYLFFVMWIMFGLAPHMQIIALDMTACETWFITPITGVLGAIAVAIETLVPRLNRNLLIIIALVILVALGVRSGIRGLDYKSQETLSLKDIAITDRNYLAMNNLAKYYINHDDPAKAEWYARQSIEFFPAVSNYNNLGVIRQKLRDFAGAKEAYQKALDLVPLRVCYENVAIVNFVVGNSNDNIAFLKKGLEVYPTNNRLWTYLAIEESAIGDNDNAKFAISNAYKLGPIPVALYNSIMQKIPLDIPMPDTDKVIKIRW